MGANLGDGVSIVGIGALPVLKEHPLSLRQLGAAAVRSALADAGIDHADALFVGNMLADELQGQKHLASLIADEAGLRWAEALTVRAATATGAAALRMAYLAVASGSAEVAVALGVEKMSSDRPHVVSSLAKALDAELEVPNGATLLSQNAKLLALYANCVGILGGMAVGAGVLDIPPAAYWIETQSIIDLSDLNSGLIKSFAFGLLIALASCWRGLQAERSAAGVGRAATSAVVTSVLLVIVADALFAVVFNILGW